jgi:ParB family chromosome partitioning protein
MTALPKKRLGRGLAALIGDDLPTEAAHQEEQVAREGLKELPIEQITSNKLNPRKTFNESDLEDLARSIAEKGILQPVVVRPSGDGDTLSSGRRRTPLACGSTCRTAPDPRLIRELSDEEVLEIAIIENVQRADLNPCRRSHGLSAAD